MPERILVAIPVFNEVKYLTRVLEQVRRYARDILVIDDGSTDRTPTLLAKQRDIAILTHLENRGYGKSLANAFAYARRERYDWIITMDCDEQHEPSHIPLFMAAAGCGDADVISGTRYPDGHRVDRVDRADWADSAVPADRRRINREMTELINRRLGLGITDAFCGFKAYRVDALRHIGITVPGYAMPMQFWVQVARAGLRVRELPVRLIYNDPTRHFGGLLDDPEARRRHYLEVFEAEWSRAPVPEAYMPTRWLPCRSQR